MADVVKQKLDENHYKLEAELEPRSDVRACNCHDQALCHRFCLYLFPACALITSMFLIPFAFRTPHPGIALGSSFLLLVLAMFYCVIGSLVKCWMPHSADERCDSDSDIYDKTNVSLIVVSTDEAPELGGHGEKVWISKNGEKLIPKMSRLLFLFHSIVQRSKTRRKEEGKVENAWWFQILLSNTDFTLLWKYHSDCSLNSSVEQMWFLVCLNW